MVTPLVSICIPTYNPKLKHLHQLIETIERQSWPSIEVVISDDGSRNFEEFTSNIPKSRFPRKIVASPINIGMANNWNKSIDFAGGDYVLVVGQDDIIAENGVELLVDAARRHGVDLVFGGQGYIGSNGTPISNPSKAIQRTELFSYPEIELEPQDVLELGLVYGNVLGDPCSTLIKREAFTAVGGFSEDFRHAADLELWLRLSLHGLTSLTIDNVVASHRAHADNATASHVSNGIAQIDRLKIHQKYGDTILDDYIWNRSVVRLYTHLFFDVLRYRVRPIGNLPKLRGSVVTKLKSWTLEIAELLRIRPPKSYGISHTN